MRIVILTFCIPLISLILTGCSSSYGNVVPKTGPTMEQVYDGMGVSKNPTQSMQSQGSNITNNSSETTVAENDISQIRSDEKQNNSYSARTVNRSVNGFQKLQNPELKLYVYPHLSGESEIPIPGYNTAFNAYDRDHYALPQDTVRQ